MKFLAKDRRASVVLRAPHKGGSISVVVPVSKTRVVEITAEQVHAFGPCIDALVADGTLVRAVAP